MYQAMNVEIPHHLAAHQSIILEYEQKLK